MKRKQLTLSRETIRTLTPADLGQAGGGVEVTSSGPDRCPAPSVGAPSCTGCPSINASCPTQAISCNPVHCPIYTF